MVFVCVRLHAIVRAQFSLLPPPLLPLSTIFSLRLFSLTNCKSDVRPCRKKLITTYIASGAFMNCTSTRRESGREKRENQEAREGEESESEVQGLREKAGGLGG